MRNNESEQLDLLFSAMAKAQGEMGEAGKGSVNPHLRTRFSDINDLIRATRPALHKHGLTVIQNIITDDDGVSYLRSRLGHSSGQWIQSWVKINPKAGTNINPDQSFGSSVTYLCRYSYKPLVGVITHDEDDDGESYTQESKVNGVKVLDQNMITEMDWELRNEPDIRQNILERGKWNQVKDIPYEKFSAVIEEVRRLKRVKEGKV